METTSVSNPIPKFSHEIDKAIEAVVSAHTRIVTDGLMVGSREIRELAEEIATLALQRTDVELAWLKVAEGYSSYRRACDELYNPLVPA